MKNLVPNFLYVLRLPPSLVYARIRQAEEEKPFDTLDMLPCGNLCEEGADVVTDESELAYAKGVRRDATSSIAA